MAPDTHWLGVWMGPRAGLDSGDKEENIPSMPLPGNEFHTSSP